MVEPLPCISEVLGLINNKQANKAHNYIPQVAHPLHTHQLPACHGQPFFHPTFKVCS